MNSYINNVMQLNGAPEVIMVKMSKKSKLNNTIRSDRGGVYGKRNGASHAIVCSISVLLIITLNAFDFTMVLQNLWIEMAHLF